MFTVRNDRLTISKAVVAPPRYRLISYSTRCRLSSLVIHSWGILGRGSWRDLSRFPSSGGAIPPGTGCVDILGATNPTCSMDVAIGAISCLNGVSISTINLRVDWDSSVLLPPLLTTHPNTTPILVWDCPLYWVSPQPKFSLYNSCFLSRQKPGGR